MYKNVFFLIKLHYNSMKPPPLSSLDITSLHISLITIRIIHRLLVANMLLISIIPIILWLLLIVLISILRYWLRIWIVLTIRVMMHCLIRIVWGNVLGLYWRVGLNHWLLYWLNWHTRLVKHLLKCLE